MRRSVTLECVVENMEAAAAAERAGANRLELCVRLDAGGVTPPDALIAAVRDRVSIPVFVMIRPRAGDFVYTDDEFSDAMRQAREARERGAHGLVTGILHQNGQVDVERTRIIVEAAGDLPVTFHRAFDEVPDQSEGLEAIIAAGARRVLTSGGAATAHDGADRIAALVRQGGERITVLAGGGVRAHNVDALIARTGVTEVHARFENAAATRALAALLYSSADD
jgi:copper homeostasis protein